MTHRLYYHDTSCLIFTAEVVGHADGNPCRVLLDQSAFYPTSGGQPHDLGTLEDIAVLEVTDAGDQVVHHLAAPLDVGQSVTGRVEPARRRDHMQQHTAQHLLSALLADRLDRPTVSVHFGATSSSIEVVGGVLSDGHLADLSRWATEAVAAALPVTVGFEEPTDAVARGLRTPPSREGVLRIVTIENMDRSACGGTHVDRTSALGLIHLLGTERIRGHARLSFVAGDRSARLLTSWGAERTVLAQSLGCSQEELLELLPRRMAELSAMRAEVDALRDGELQRQVAAAVSATAPGPDGVRRVVYRVERQEVLGRMAQLAAGMDRVALYLVAPLPAGVAVAVGTSPDSGIDAGAAMRSLLAQRVGRGGGSPRVAQGLLSDPEVPGDPVWGGEAIL